jgi:RNA dependent RNA polymerase
MMANGFRLVGREWEFLGYSMSGLREHSVWFVNPFKSDEEPHILMSAARFRFFGGQLDLFLRQLCSPLALGISTKTTMLARLRYLGRGEATANKVRLIISMDTLVTELHQSSLGPYG